MKLLQKFAYFWNDLKTWPLMPSIFLALASASLLGVVALVVLAPGQPTYAEVAFWRSVNSSQRAELDLYLKTWPHGAFVSLANLRLDELREKAGTARPAASSSGSMELRLRP